MALDIRTPGVYIQELDAFTNSIVPVPTAVPAFVGYTAQAKIGKQSLLNKPTKISSMMDYLNYFGKGPSPKYTYTADPGNTQNPKGFTLTAPTDSFNMYYAMQFFFANGGTDCYIVSVGNYDTAPAKAILEPGIEALKKFPEPTMLLVPDAVLLAPADYASVVQAMMMHCGSDMKSRVALIDIQNGDKALNDATTPVDTFRNIGINFSEYGTTYYPWLHTSITASSDVDFTFIVDFATTLFANSEIEAAATSYLSKQQIDTSVTTAADVDGTNEALNKGLHNALFATNPEYKAVMNDLLLQINLLPPTPAMAGIYTAVDHAVGVWKAPANVSMAMVSRPAVHLDDDEQADLNVPLDGKAVNAIRLFPGKGTIVWGARTLDGNSQDWRYISVRRTVIFIEQSIKIATEAFVFAANDSQTWNQLKSMISQFLTSVWAQGGLAGAKASDAFSVACGLGTTMTAVDILNGRLNVMVKIAVTHPAEFIIITIQQQLQKS